MGFLAQKVEHQCTKLKVAGSSAAEVHFFLLPSFLSKTDQARLGLVALDSITIMSKNCGDCIVTQVDQCNIVC